MDSTPLVVAAILIVLLLLFGGLPGRIAAKRNHPNAYAVKLLGWAGMTVTFGALWFVALVWAYADSPAKIATGLVAPETRDRKRCPWCAELVHVEAKICKHCHKEFESPASARNPA